LAKREGTKTANGIAVTLPDNNQEVAAQIGTVRELVSRNLSRFEAEGLLDIDARNLLIRDLKALESEVSEES
jgi:CRP/FNR family transcriptional regulator